MEEAGLEIIELKSFGATSPRTPPHSTFYGTN